MTYQSDPTLLAEIRKYGKFDTNACLQCGSCTAVCDLNDDIASFPRRTIRYALLGLKEPLLRSLDPWLCYYCGDCSTSCPRETDPGEAMMTLRRYLTAQYDWTGLAGRICKSKWWEIGALLFVAALTLALIVFYHLWKGWDLAFLAAADCGMGLTHMFGDEGRGLIYDFTLVTCLLPLAILLLNACRMYWYTMRRGREDTATSRPYLRQAKTLVFHAATQRRFRDCSDRWPWLVHFSIVVGCVLMFILLVFFLKWFQTDNVYPIHHPQRWLGYLATVALLFGSGGIIVGRIRRRRELHKFSRLGDWTLPVLLFLTALSGILVHIFRYLELEVATNYSYAIHLMIAVPMLIVEIPFGKLSHMFYRPLAIYFHSVEEQAPERQVQKEVILGHAT